MAKGVPLTAEAPDDEDQLGKEVVLVQPALGLAPASAALSRCLLFLFFGATCTRFGPASTAFTGLCFFLFSANCTGLGSASSCLAGFLLFPFGATCAGFCSSAARSPDSRDAGAGQESGERERGQEFLEPLLVHDAPPHKLDDLQDWDRSHPPETV